MGLFNALNVCRECQTGRGFVFLYSEGRCWYTAIQFSVQGWSSLSRWQR